MKLITTNNKDNKYDVVELIVAQAILDRSDKIEVMIQIELKKLQQRLLDSLK